MDWLLFRIVFTSLLIGIIVAFTIIVSLPTVLDMGKYAAMIIGGLAIVMFAAGIVIYMNIFEAAKQKGADNLDIYDFMKPAPIGGIETFMNWMMPPVKETYTNATKSPLCDFYVASSAHSVIPGNTVYTYTTEEAIKKVIRAGARLVELHVYEEKGEAVVGLSDTIRQERYTYNNVPFEDCCLAIANSAFDIGTTTASSDPFILSLVFHTENTKLMNGCADTMLNTMRRYLLGPEYGYQRKVITSEPVTKFSGKIIVVSGGNVKGSAMEELVNLSWAGSHLRRLTYKEASMPYDHEDLINFNRKGITMVVPDIGTSLENGNPEILFTYGCQWIMMNYGSLDDAMSTYVSKFSAASFVPKPDELKEKLVTMKKPKKQSQDASFQPMTTSVGPGIDVTI